MKTVTTLLTICCFGFATVCQAQTDQKNSKTDTAKQMNLLDEQTKIYGQVFDLAGAGEDNPLDGAKNYLEAIEKMDVPQEQKETLREQYKIYDLSLDANKKDSLKLMVNKMLTEAIDKSQTEIEK